MFTLVTKERVKFRLSEAYNKKNLIDENYVAVKLRVYWAETSKSYVWSSSIKIFEEKVRVWVCLTFGYKQESKEPLYFSTFGIECNYCGVFYAVHANVDHCWGTTYPDPWKVICFYREEIRDVLFKSGSRNKKTFNYPE